MGPQPRRLGWSRWSMRCCWTVVALMHRWTENRILGGLRVLGQCVDVLAMGFVYTVIRFWLQGALPSAPSIETSFIRLLLLSQDVRSSRAERCLFHVNLRRAEARDTRSNPLISPPESEAREAKTGGLGGEKNRFLHCRQHG